ncbi:hypothetical protein [Cysteiniphilum litorale]|nr:hypothetical protein [Cysteiniphilum litorale]
MKKNLRIFAVLVMALLHLISGYSNDHLKNKGVILKVNHFSFFVPKKDSVCAYEIINQKDDTSTHSYNCQLHIYHDTEDNTIVLTYEIKGQWTSQYAQADDGWYWHITEVPNPKSRLVLYAPFFAEFKDIGLKMTVVSKSSFKNELTINGGLLVIGNKLHTLTSVAKLSLSTGYPLFEGSMQWEPFHTVSV